MLKLMYITNNPEIARIAEDAGVDRIFVDLEHIGKTDRQGGMDTVQSHHTIEDVKEIRNVGLHNIHAAQLVVINQFYLSNNWRKMNKFVLTCDS